MHKSEFLNILESFTESANPTKQSVNTKSASQTACKVRAY